jgi:hypothetical protein
MQQMMFYYSGDIYRYRIKEFITHKLPSMQRVILQTQFSLNFSVKHQQQGLALELVTEQLAMQMK